MMRWMFLSAQRAGIIKLSEKLIQKLGGPTGRRMSRNFLVIDPAERPDGLRGFASPARARILRLLLRRPGLNVNDIAEALSLPQSTVSSYLQILEPAGLIRTEMKKGGKGNKRSSS